MLRCQAATAAAWTACTKKLSAISRQLSVRSKASLARAGLFVLGRSVPRETLCSLFCTYLYVCYRRQMKRKKRVKRRGRVAILRASGGVEQQSAMSRREQWRERQLELERWLELPKKRVTLNLDADVLAWFRGMGRGYQWVINKALRRVMEREQRAGSR